MDWSKTEVDLAVFDYMAMLSDELQGKPVNKTEHRKALMPLLNNRSPSSVEFKHQNTSAALIGLGFPYIMGYKPRGNFQALLLQGVLEYLENHPKFSALVAASIEKPAILPPIASYLERMEPPPDNNDWDYSQVREKGGNQRRPVHIDFLEREARNASLGLAGEKFVVEFEKERLVQMGEAKLAGRVEHVSVTLGDGLGFDIRSFDSKGEDRLIEVKTTAGGKQTPFFVSRNELQVSQEKDQAYHLYRVFRFRKDPRLFSVCGVLNKVCKLEPSQYSARFG